MRGRRMTKEDGTMGDAPKISVEKAVAIIAEHCAETDCKHCSYAATVPGWDFYICMFRSITPCDWEPSENENG